MGFEHRKETVTYIPDAAFNSGQLSGLGGTEAPVDNSIGVGEEFIEARVPLLQDLPFGLRRRRFLRPSLSAARSM